MQAQKIPQHIAFIMDGNGRWAQQKGVSRAKGHEEGAKSVHIITEAAKELGVKYVTLYAFSCENWARPKTEITALMALLKKTLKDFADKKNEGVKLVFSGRREKLPKDVLAMLDKAVKNTEHNTSLTLNLALNYGAQQEITDAVNKLIAQGKKKIEEQDITDNLYVNIPAPDLIIRTSGEQRLSNFLLWQAAYSEFYFTEILWPDFRRKQLQDAIAAFAARERRYGAR